MAEVKWIKIVTDIFDDEKILLIESMPEADAIIVIWFKMLCLAGKQNNSGVFQLHGRIAYTDEMFATIFRRPLNTVRLALKTFEQFGMIEIVNDTVTIPNWGKHQSIEQIEARREYQRIYHQAYRKQQKLLIEGGNEPRKRLRKQDVNAPDKIREDKNREEKKREDTQNPSDSCAEPEKPASTPDEPAVFSLELNDGSMHGITRADFEKYVSLYPAVDVMQELRKMAGWLDGNPTRRKTRSGVKRFINSWLAKVQDQGGRGSPPRRRGAIDRDNNRVPERYGGGEII